MSDCCGGILIELVPGLLLEVGITTGVSNGLKQGQIGDKVVITTKRLPPSLPPPLPPFHCHAPTLKMQYNDFWSLLLFPVLIPSTPKLPKQ